ncbi:hypothetical protein BLNAU_19379 [Blattamonas nauphoetae]|uniref:Uncharacterized protein n=1 Tax=Blattamonas nauphoetae TaxID=2049346 RepID=A0ABQ9X1Q4_9EUKA|nr:hypothetical protein BLNAU_19379 [Blattamonas nauphoetae]
MSSPDDTQVSNPSSFENSASATPNDPIKSNSPPPQIENPPPRTHPRKVNRSTSNPRRKTDRQSLTDSSDLSRSQSTGSRRGRYTHNFLDSNDPNFENALAKYERSPGPAYDTGHATDKFLLKSQGGYKMGTSARQMKEPERSPGPIYGYNADILSQHPSSARSTIGKSKLKSSVIIDSAFTGPLYSVGESHDRFVLPRVPGYKMGTGPRDLKDSTCSPGPIYNYRTDTLSTHTNAARGTIGKAQHKSFMIRETAAANAAINDPTDPNAFGQRSPRATFGKAPREINKIAETPGPGSYYSAPQRKAGPSKGTFGTSERGSIQWIFS